MIFMIFAGIVSICYMRRKKIIEEQKKR